MKFICFKREMFTEKFGRCIIKSSEHRTLQGYWAYLLLQVVRPCCNATLATFCVFYRWQDRSGGIYTC